MKEKNAGSIRFSIAKILSTVFVMLLILLISLPVIRELYMVNVAVTYKMQHADAFQVFWYNDKMENPNNRAYYEEMKSERSAVAGGDDYKQANFLIPLRHLGALRIDPGTGINQAVTIKQVEIKDFFTKKSFSGDIILDTFSSFNGLSYQVANGELLLTSLSNDPSFAAEDLNLTSNDFALGQQATGWLLSVLGGFVWWLLMRKFSWQRCILELGALKCANAQAVKDEKEKKPVSILDQLHQFWTFLMLNKIYVAITIMLAALAYGYLIANFGLTIDSEVKLVEGYDKSNILVGWLTNGRYGVSLIKAIFNDFYIIPFWNKFLSVAILGLAAWVFSYVLQEEMQESQKKSVSAFIFASIFISAVFSLYYIVFDSYNIEISVGLLLSAICIRLSTKFAVHHGGWKYFWMGSILLSFTIGIYQSFVNVYISAVLLMLILSAIRVDKEINGFLKTIFRIIRYVFTLIVAFIIFYCTQKLLETAFSVTDVYTSGYINWGQGLSLGFYYTGKAIKHVLTCMESKFIIPTACLTILVLVTSILAGKIRHKHVAFLFLVFMMSPFLMRLSVGGDMPVRADQALVLTFAGLWYCVFIMLNRWNWKFPNRVAVIAVVFISLFQTQISARLTAGDYERYVQDVMLAAQIDYKISEVASENTGKPVAFIGNKDIEPGHTLIIKSMDELGKSAFEWRHPYNTRKNFFMFTLGYQYQQPSLEQFQKATETANSMPIWPSQESVVELDDVIVVKLS